MGTEYEKDGPSTTPVIDFVEKNKHKAVGSGLFNSNRKDYFNQAHLPVHSHNTSQLHKINESRSHARNESSQFLASSGNHPHQRS